MRYAIVLLAAAAWAAPKPPYMPDNLSAVDRALFEKLARAELESMWSALVAEGYPSCFIHELNPIHVDRKMIGRARTIRYLPNRKDLRDKVYGAQPQLNYKGSEEAMPGDILVFDAGGETRSAVTGEMTTLRFIKRGGVGMVADGAFRDVPGMADMPIQVYMRRGQAAAVAPVQMSVDYQIPVRIGGVTVVPGDILVGERHGILVIPAALASKIADKAMETVEKEEFQRVLLEQGEPIYGVYPRLSDANQKKFEEWKKQR
jgi:regulator of RNase E activity RraA